MKPIQDLLNRIRWDKEYSKSEFVLGYYDRIRDELIFVPFREISFEDDDNFSFLVYDEEGASHTVPFHRVRELYRDGEIIWHRDG